MTHRGAINVIEKYASVPKSETVKTAYSMAISALDKRVPKKTERTKTEYGERQLFYRCPVCKDMSLILNGDNYCTNCGQALDWSDTK